MIKKLIFTRYIEEDLMYYEDAQTQLVMTLAVYLSAGSTCPSVITVNKRQL